MAGENALVRSIRQMVKRMLENHTTVELGLVTAVNDGETPPTLTVGGKKMPYSDAIDTPAKGDTVAFLVAERFVIGRRA